MENPKLKSVLIKLPFNNLFTQSVRNIKSIGLIHNIAVEYYEEGYGIITNSDCNKYRLLSGMLKFVVDYGS